MLEVATHDAERVWPVFVVDRALLERHKAARGRVAWFAASVRALDERLRRGGRALRLNLDPNDRAALVAFLMTLNDPVLTTDPRFSDPFRRSRP